MDRHRSVAMKVLAGSADRRDGNAMAWISRPTTLRAGSRRRPKFFSPKNSGRRRDPARRDGLTPTNSPPGDGERDLRPLALLRGRGGGGFAAAASAAIVGRGFLHELKLAAAGHALVAFRHQRTLVPLK